MIKTGLYPTMVTPFDDKGNIDYKDLYKFIEKLEKDGSDGLFAVCQSSEMFDLSLKEKIQLASFVKKNSRLDVIASGHTQKDPDEQIEAMKKIADTGVDAVVLISNRFADENEGDDVFIKSLDYFLTNFKEPVPLGIYECPYPYKRLLSDKALEYILDTGRFVFLKDTSCDKDVMKRRMDIIEGSGFGLYNAHVEYVMDTVRMGAAGFSGVMANVSVKLVKCMMEDPEFKESFTRNAYNLVAELADHLRSSYYPISAKAMLVDMGIFSTINTRVKDRKLYNAGMAEEGRAMLHKIREFEIEYDKRTEM